MANNLKRLASQRTDVFDPVTGRPLGEEEQARLKKAATTYAGAADVNASKGRPTVGQGSTIDEQIKSIHERYAQ
jgi:splicing factor 3A subunit 1